MITPGAGAVDTSFYSQGSLQGNNAKDPEKVAGMFESIFYRMMLTQVREGSLGDPLFDSPAMKQVQGLFDDEFAQKLGESGDLGIADLMMETVEKQNNAVKPADFSGLIKG